MQTYISVNDDNQSNQVVKLLNNENEFKGNLFTTNKNNELTNIKDLFVWKDELNSKLEEYVSIEDFENGFTFENMDVKTLTINGKQPSLVGHKHTIGDIIDSNDLVTNASLATALSEYAKISEVTGDVDLSGYVTDESLNTKLSSYATTEYVDGQISSINNSGYVTNESLTTTLEGYATTGTLDEINQKIDDISFDGYVTEDSLTTTLEGYIKESDLEEGFEFDSIKVSNLTIDGKKPSLEGHSHTLSDITGISNALSQADDDISDAKTISEIKTALLTLIRSLNVTINEEN